MSSLVMPWRSTPSILLSGWNLLASGLKHTKPVMATLPPGFKHSYMVGRNVGKEKCDRTR